MPLLDLPNEILCRILHYFRPDEIEDFGHCCSHVYMLAKNLLNEHYEAKRTEHTLTVRCRASFDEVSVLSSTELCNIIKHPHIAYYRTTLHYRDNPVGNHHVSNNRRFEAMEKETRFRNTRFQCGVSELVDQCIHIVEEDREYWREGILGGDEDMALALLLTLLPNLETITMWDQLGGAMVHKMINSIASHGFHENKQLALTKLKSIRMERIQGSVGSKRLCALTMFAQLPSVESLWGGRVRGGRERMWPLGPRLSEVTAVHLECPIWDEYWADEFLTGFKGLRSFSYVCSGAEGLREDINHTLILIFSALPEHTKESLEDLSIMDIESYPDANYLGLFCGYKKLRTLRAGVDIFIKQSKGEVQVQRLVDILPRTLEGLIIEAVSYPEHAAMFQDLAKLKAEYLPNLTEMALELRRSDQMEEENWRTLCEEAGISVSFL